MNKRLDKKIAESKPNVKPSKTFTDDVMKEIEHIDLKKARRWSMLQSFRPAFAVAALVLVVGGVTVASGGQNSSQHNPVEHDEVATEEQKTVGFEQQSQQQTEPESRNKSEGSGDVKLSYTTEEQLTEPTTVAEAKVEMETIVSDIETEVVTFDEDLDFADELLSDDTLSLDL